MKLALFLLFSILDGSRVWGQALVETDLGSQTPSVLVQALLGPGVSYSNVTYQGIGISSGTFTGGTGIIGFDSGIILSNGAAANVVGPNTNSADTCNSLPGDTDLANLAGVPLSNTFDATVLSFDFIPTANNLSFQYVFASDEYNVFIGNYDDVFGFFVNGTNVALIPGTSTVVSINTINNCQNPTYFIDNSNGSSNTTCTIVAPSANLNTSMYGLTTVLSVNALVTPGVVNHIKLAICDVGDCALDSNVFIRANSFVSGNTPTPTNSPTNTPTPTATDTPTLTPTVTPTSTQTSTPTTSPTVTPTFTLPPTATITPTNTPTTTPTITPTFTPTCEIHVWPDPFNPNYAVNGTLKVSCLPSGTTVSFFTLAGELVNQLPEVGGMIQWNGKNQQGVPVSPGIYYYVIKNGQNPLGKGKFLVSR